MTSAADELVERARKYAAGFDHGGLKAPPSLGVAIVACMDARITPYGLFQLAEGEAHVIRNAGGVVTDDVIRSLAISQHLLGTREVLLVHHADCGMRTFGDDDFRRRLYEATGIRPHWAAEAFDDSAADVRQSIARIQASPFIAWKEALRGFVYDDATGSLTEVT